MFRFFNDVISNEPLNNEFKFLIIIGICNKYAKLIFELESIAHLLTPQENLSYRLESLNYMRHLGLILDGRTDNFASLHVSLGVFQSILNAFYLREVAKPDTRDFVI